MKYIPQLLCVALFIFSGCATTSNIVYDYNLNVDFDKYSTFVICTEDLFPETTTHPKIDNEVNRSIIANAITKELELKGHETNVFNPELQAGFRIVVNKETVSFKDCSYSEDFGYWKECKITEETYDQESLIVYIADFKTNTIIWQASIYCNLNKSDKKLQYYISTLVSKLYDTYPKGQLL